MADNVNVFAKDIRNTIKKNVSFLPDAWVIFYDDITGDVMEKAQAAIDNQDPNANYELILNQIADWNFADEKGTKLDITVENLKKLPIKFIRWMGQAQYEILNVPEIVDKKKE